MLQIDNRTGSMDLYPQLKARGVPTVLTRLSFGDLAFLGNGPDDQLVSVGVEYKTIWDVLKCVTDGRFAGHQLPGMISNYQVCWLLMEGRWRSCTKSGVLQIQSHRGEWRTGSVGQRTFMYRDLVHWLLSIQTIGGIRLMRSGEQGESVSWLAGLYGWWQKPWTNHRSLNVQNLSGMEQWTGRASLVKPTILRRMAAELPGIGWEKSKSVEAKFSSVEDMVLAGEGEWREIEGIGKVMASRIVKCLRGGIE